MTDFKIIFVHGYTASSKADWYPTISKELDRLHVDYSIPNLPGGKYPHAKEWLKVIHEEVEKANKPLVLVGHSLGTRAVLLYLEKYRLKVKKVLLAAAFANKTENKVRHDDGKSYEDFFEHKINLEDIKSFVDEFVVMHSKDDCSIEYSQAVEIAIDLNAKLVTYEYRDHFSRPDDSSEILKVLRMMLKF